MPRKDWLQYRYEILPAVIYVGQAAQGVLSSEPAWTIRKIDLDADGNPTHARWTDTTSVWDNRASETYT